MNGRSFAFNAENMARARKAIQKYPEGRQASAVLPLLDLAQRQNGNWLSIEAMDYVAKMLEMPPVRVYEVASFYTMFNLKPVGEHLVQVCTTTPCWLRGSGAIVEACKEKLGIGMGETTPDGKFTLRKVECLGACVNGPVVQINDDVYEDLTPQTVEKVLGDLEDGRKPVAGSQAGRTGSEPRGGADSKERT
ncbi:MAG: NADH-quinone oxidoreductase subunit NuoE [Alphaproteobacteria bacterium]|nr:NADH-quinone oxidoreductase subunit NuoE [Alphaproteobacteria bacterium]